MRYHFAPTRMAMKKKKTENKKCCQGNGNPYTLLMGNVRWYDYYGKIWQFLKKLNVELIGTE